MRIVRQLGLALVTVCALGAVAASSASAGSPLFLFHGSGGRLLASAGGTQTFTAAGHIVECNALEVTQGTATLLRFLALLVRVKYTSCKAEGIFTATVHPVHYIIDANGLVTVASDVLILVPSAACTITIPASKNQSLNTIKFENTPANHGILLLANVTKINSSGEGVGCEYKNDTAGTYEGSIHVIAHGGLLKWDLNA